MQCPTCDSIIILSSIMQCNCHVKHESDLAATEQTGLTYQNVLPPALVIGETKLSTFT